MLDNYGGFDVDAGSLNHDLQRKLTSSRQRSLTLNQELVSQIHAGVIQSKHRSLNYARQQFASSPCALATPWLLSWLIDSIVFGGLWLVTAVTCADVHYWSIVRHTKTVFGLGKPASGFEVCLFPVSGGRSSCFEQNQTCPASRPVTTSPDRRETPDRLCDPKSSSRARGQNCTADWTKFPWNIHSRNNGTRASDTKRSQGACIWLRWNRDRHDAHSLASLVCDLRRNWTCFRRSRLLYISWGSWEEDNLCVGAAARPQTWCTQRLRAQKKRLFEDFALCSEYTMRCTVRTGGLCQGYPYRSGFRQLTAPSNKR